jgi:RNA polymerase sigma factor (sigma-70 family)
MPIRDGEKFATRFIAETEEEAAKLMKRFDIDISMSAFQRHRVTGIDLEDLKQEGLIGLARANRDFDESRSVDFRIFALYKIKDAMREFITTQASNIRVPQYIKDTIHLIESLKKVVGQVCDISYASYIEIWELSQHMRVKHKHIQQNINKVKGSLNSLADRAHSSVVQLLERAEIMPKLTIEVSDYVAISPADVFAEENNMIELISNKESIVVLENILDESEMALLWDRYAEGITERELEAKMGIKASTINVRTKNILDKVRLHRDRILQNETHTTIKETEQGQPS